MSRGALVCVIVFAACGDNAQSECESWRQWGNSSSHDGASCVAGQPLGRSLADLVIDPFIDAEEYDAGGDLTIHYQAPLVDGDDVYMMSKAGTYTPCATGSDGKPSCFSATVDYRLDSEVWSEQAFGWDGSGALYQRWSFDSDWKPEPGIGFEPMYQPALAGDLIALAGAGGALWELDRHDGSVVRHVMPFGDTLDPDTYVAGGIGVGGDGTLYYNALKLDHDMPFELPPQSWLVAVSPDGTTQIAGYPGLVTGAPQNDDPCYYTFTTDTTPLPWPPPTGLPQQFNCGSQRPGINSTPAIGADGTIFIVSRAHYNERYSYIVAVHPDLTTKWALSLRGLLADGCGVTIPSDGTATENMDDCAVGAPMGVEPATGMAPAATVDDDSSASPVALPDGGVLYGSFSSYNGYRGHLIKVDATGTFARSYEFGWDDTPAIVGTGSDYSIVTKDNHYGEDANGVDLGPYYITELDSSLNVKWQFLSTNTQSCARQADGSVTCDADHPHGFEWCINAPVVDRDGVTYVNSEDGTAYAINPDGSLRDSLFLDKAEGAAYTPVVLDHDGRVFAINNGHLVVIGKP